MSQQFDTNFNEWQLTKKDAIELGNICSRLEIDKKTDLFCGGCVHIEQYKKEIGIF